MATHEVLNQPPPLVDYNLFAGDRALGEAVGREGAGWAAGELSALGKRGPIPSRARMSRALPAPSCWCRSRAARNARSP